MSKQYVIFEARQHDVKPTIFGVEIGSKSFQAGAV